MSKRQFSRKLAAILSADVEGYSRLMSQDETQTVIALKANRDIIKQLVEEHIGQVIDSPGDNILAKFSSVVNAVNCALEIQEEIGKINQSLPVDRQMIFRIGINLGDIIEDEGRIYGDGVNIAARLERLAQGGGICMSGGAFEQVQNKVPIGCEFLGKQHVKNIAKPVPVFRIWKDSDSKACAISTNAHPNKRRNTFIAAGIVAVFIVATILILYAVNRPFSASTKDSTNRPVNMPSNKASIAVLPFQNLSDDPSQEYFSDGITNDIITDLSKFKQLNVTASNKIFQYKGKPTDLRKLGQELNVKYILEGSIQKSVDRVRINAQLIDADSGNHIWADRFNRDIEDIFALQDEIIATIVRKLSVKVHQSELSLAMRKNTQNLEAYDYYLRAYYHFFQRGRENITEARRLFAKALEIDPSFASAYVGLAKARTWAVMYGYTEFPNIVLQEALKAAKKAIQLDSSNASAHAELGYIYMRLGEYDVAKHELQTATDLNPNDWISYRYIGAVLLYSGDPDAALKWYEQATKYDPYQSPGVYMNVGIAHYLKGDDDKALEWLKEAAVKWPTFLGCHILMASIYGNAGELEKAAVEKDKILSLSPFFRLKFYGQAYRNPKHREKIVSGLKKAGLV